MSIALLNIGAVSVLFGIFWAMWNRRANPPIVLLIVGVLALLIGWSLSKQSAPPYCPPDPTECG